MNTAFVDLPAGEVGEIIEKLHQDGYVVGRSTKPPMFYPYSQMTRAEIAVLVVRAEHGANFTPPAVTTPPFPDVRPDYWGASWIAQAAKDKHMLPQQDGKFYPTSPALRMDVAVLFAIR